VNRFALPKGYVSMLGFKTRRPLLLLTALFAGLFTAACDDGTSPGSANQDGPATIRILLTDAPHPAIGAALVDIGRVEILPAGGGDHIVLSEDGTDGFVNLLDLQGPATLPIAEAEIEPGSFSQLRLFVDSARVELAGDYEFRDGTTVKDLKVPSGAQTGIKLILHSGDDEGPLEIIPGETVLVLDFDVGESFVMLGNPDTPAGIHGVNFKPTIRVTGYDVAASISGTVTKADGLDEVSVEGLTVRAVPTDGGTVAGYQSETGTAVTDENGAYTIHYLVPGTYEVSVDLEPGLGTDPATDPNPVTLGNSEDATGVDFEIIDVKGSIAGTVSTQLNGVTVVGLTVTATPDAEGQEPLVTTTGDGGLYLFESVIPGSYTVTVTVADGQTTTPPSAEFELTNNEDKTEVNFTVVAAS